MDLQDSVFLRACRRERVPHTPVWLMRQAGRYQPSYQAVRRETSFLDLCRTPELACRVTVDAVDQLGVDAAIVFADILLVLAPLGIDFHFEPGAGPKIEAPLRSPRDVERVAESIDARRDLGFVMDAIRAIRAELDPRGVPLIGFAGAPFTMASYAIEGGGSRDYRFTKQLMYGDEGAWNELMARISRALTDYLLAQIEAGAHAVQLFDSWVGTLGRADYERYVQPHVASIFSALEAATGGAVPLIHFGQGNPELYPSMKDAGGDVISVDWRAPITEVWARLGDDVAVQGNLEPVSVLAPREAMLARARALLDEVGGRDGHIFNLGHGLLRWSEVEQVRALVDFVHEASAR